MRKSVCRECGSDFVVETVNGPVSTICSTCKPGVKRKRQRKAAARRAALRRCIPTAHLCVVCGTQFQKKNGRGSPKFCSDACRAPYDAERRRRNQRQRYHEIRDLAEPVVLNLFCEVCEQQFSWTSKPGRKPRTCSDECRKEKKLIDSRVIRYGITEAQYAEILEGQSGKCAVCRRYAVLVVDHDHYTGAVRGLLCSRCNVSIGGLGDTAEALEIALAYLRRKPSCQNQ